MLSAQKLALLATTTLALAGGSGCASIEARAAMPAEPAALSAALVSELRALGPRVSAADASQVADVVLATIERLASEYRVFGPPKMNNVLINAGMRPRGLCCHWADDLIDPLLAMEQESFRFQWAVAHHGDAMREHNSVIVQGPETPWERGLIIDPWRTGGYPFWVRVGDDKYPWVLHELSGQWETLRCQ